MGRTKLFRVIAANLKKQGAKKVAVFGSYARNEQKKNSDIDIIVEFKNKKSLLEIVKIERQLSELTGIKVDLSTKNSISPYLIESIKKEMEVLV
jgi:uncharacterized protein